MYCRKSVDQRMEPLEIPATTIFSQRPNIQSQSSITEIC